MNNDAHSSQYIFNPYKTSLKDTVIKLSKITEKEKNLKEETYTWEPA